MGFLDRLADWLAPSVPPPQVAPQPAVPTVPAELPRIAARTAGEICKVCKPGDAAKKLLKPQETPSQFLSALQEKHLSAEMVKVIAHGLPDREGVAWAVQCAEKVAGTLPAPDALAMRAAQAWVKSPTAENQAAAAAAFERTDKQGPGAWAAQAVAWAGEGTPKPPAEDGKPMPRLTPDAVVMAVLLSSTIQARPEFARRQLPAMQMPYGHVPTAGDLLHAQAPQVAGVVSQLQGGATVPQVLAGLAAPALGSAASVAGSVTMPVAPGVAGVAGHLASPMLPGVSGVPGSLAAGVASLAAMPGAAAQLPASALAGVASSAGSMALPTSSLSGLAGASMPTVPHAGQMGSLSQPSMPYVEVPTIPPAVHAFMFKEQYDFVAMGIAIASGQAPLV